VREYEGELINSDNGKGVIRSTMFFFFLGKRKGWRDIDIRKINIFISLGRY